MKTLCGWRRHALARLAVVGAPIPPDSRLAAHVGRCADCHRAWQELCGLAQDLPGAIPSPEASPEFQQGIWRRIDAGEIRQPRWTARHSWALAGGVAVAAVGVALVWGIGERGGPSRDNAVVHVTPNSAPSPRPLVNEGAGRGRSRLKAAPEAMMALGGPFRGLPIRSGPPFTGGLTPGVAVAHTSPPGARRPASTDLDLIHLNEGSLADARPVAPVPDLPPMPRLPLPEVEPGSRVVDDLLLLNPVRVAAADGAGLGAAAAAMTEEAAERDARLQQKVTLHAVSEPLGDVLALLTRGTGVHLMARMEVAGESITVWAENRPLIDVMRDLRHLQGYYWSRTQRGDSYVYSLWQDMQSRAREEAEEQRRVLEAQRQFVEDVRKRIGALNAGEPELKRLAQEEPYLVAQLKHPVVRAAYQLFAALSPDQQAHLLQGQSPSRSQGAGQVLEVFPRESYQDPGGGKVISDPKRVARDAPRGDVVTLRPGEMTPAQRSALNALLQGAAVMRQQEQFSEGVAELKAADRRVESVFLFRWGDPLWQGMNVRVLFTSGGHPWGVDSHFALPRSSNEGYNELLRKGEFGLWPGAQEEVDRYLGLKRTRGTKPPALPQREAEPGADEVPDPILDAPISVHWPMAKRVVERPNGPTEFRLTGREVLAVLYRDLGRPLVLEAMPWGLRQAESAEFRYEKKPLRGLLRQLFPPNRRFHTSGGTIYVTDPRSERPRHEAPRAVREFLEGLSEPFSLDDMVQLARSVSPWQMANLERYFPETPMVIDQLVQLQPLLKLYGELAPAQRSAVARGIPFTRMTPVQQGLFQSFAQQQRPFVEAWRFQQGTLRISVAPIPKPKEFVPWSVPVARATFEVQFHEDEAQSYTLLLYRQLRRDLWPKPAEIVGKRFPFPQSDRPASTAWLADASLRKKSLVIACGWRFALPYAGPGPAPDLNTWAESLAARLQNSGVPLVHLTIGPPDATGEQKKRTALPNLIRRTDPGIGWEGQPWDTSWAYAYVLTRSPSVFVVGADEIVRAVFEGQDAWDVAAIEKAAREVAPSNKQSSPSPKVGREG